MSRTNHPRVLLIAPQPFFSVRGTPLNVLQMCRALTRRGYDVDLATYPIGDAVQLAGLTIHRASRIPGIRAVPIGFSWRKLLLDLSLALTVARLLILRRYVLVHAIEEAVFIALPVSVFGVPVLYDLDSQLSDQLAYSGAIRTRWLIGMVRRLERIAVRRSRACITVSESLTRAAKGLSADAQVFQIEDAPLEEALLDPDGDEVARLRAELKLEGRPTVVYTGNFEAYQGLDLLLEATQKLVGQIPNVAVVLVGGEPSAVMGLQTRAEQLGLSANVIAVGVRPVEEVPNWMSLAHVLVSPRIVGENTPLKLYTYMHSGRPIVATDLETHTQVLDASTAILCEPTASALATGLLEGLRGGPHVDALGQRARILVEERYSSAAFGAKLLEAYATILSARPDLA